MSKIGGGRNFGYGKRITWAAKNALNDRYGDGHFSTRASHELRWRIFADFLKSECGIKDARDIDKDVIAKYGDHLNQQVQCQNMTVAYAQNLLSTVNVVLGTMRKDTVLRTSPAQCVGERSAIRVTVPRTLDRGTLILPVQRLNSKGEQQVSTLVTLCREFGLRFREASLLNTKTALRQAKIQGRINISEGTKGGCGKRAGRWVPVTPKGIELLRDACRLQGRRKNLIPEGHNYVQWRDHAYSQWRLVTEGAGIRGFHDLRAAYACERYQQITGSPAPVLTGNRRTVDKPLDQKARLAIAELLGHGRPQILASYVGSAR